MLAIVTYLCKRNLVLQWRHKANLFLPALFLLLAGFFILYLGNNPPLLLKMQIGLVLMMLAMLLPLGGLYQHDIEHGFLQIIRQSETPLLLYVYAKIISFIIAQQLALLPALLIYAIMAGVPPNMLALYLLTASFNAMWHQLYRYHVERTVANRTKWLISIVITAAFNATRDFCRFRHRASLFWT